MVKNVSSERINPSLSTDLLPLHPHHLTRYAWQPLQGMEQRVVISQWLTREILYRQP
jgi:hypothetical protein